MLIKKMRSFLNLSSTDRWAVLQALGLSLALQAGFRTLGVRRTQALLRRWIGDPVRPARPDPELISRSVRAHRMIHRSTTIGGTCLVRSLSLWAILLRGGVETTLRIGVRKHEGLTEGHAWLEYQGQPINESPSVASTYTPFDGAADWNLLRNLR